ncbi:MAG TPA: RsmD family RNA methyltransferase, partial [Bacilli bacterium]|nr:RsmD family RNA methyltransferase [Bacilli bacterium]
KQSYDLIFLDPPYRLAIIDEVIVLLINNAMLNDGAYIICHYRRKSYEPKTWKDGFGEIRILKNYHYTTNEITIYQYLKAQQE